MDMKIGEIEVRGETLDVSVTFSTYGGGSTSRYEVRRSAEDGESEVLGVGETLDAAKRSASTTMREQSADVAIPFIYIRREGAAEYFERGTAIKVDHRRGRGTVVRWEDGTLGDLREYRVLKAGEDAEKAATRIIQLRAQIKPLQAEERRLIDEYELAISTVVRDAQREAAKVAA